MSHALSSLEIHIYIVLGRTFFPSLKTVCLSSSVGILVYKGEMVYSGDIEVGWPRGTHPEKITFVAELYSLEGEPKEVIVSYPIHWIKETT